MRKDLLLLSPYTQSLATVLWGEGGQTWSRHLKCHPETHNATLLRSPPVQRQRLPPLTKKGALSAQRRPPQLSSVPTTFPDDWVSTQSCHRRLGNVSSSRTLRGSWPDTVSSSGNTVKSHLKFHPHSMRLSLLCIISKQAKNKEDMTNSWASLRK